VGERPLWAPWRLEYVTAPKDGECIFCAAARGEEEGERVLARGERCFAILNAFPYASGHLMIAPYRHVGDIEALEEEEMLELMRMAQRGAMALREVMAPDGFNVGLNLGKVAGAGFADHLHLHVVPRWEGDTSFMPVIGHTNVVPQALADTARLLRDALGSGPDAPPPS
jgi:ATP adenylyltransferase